MDGRPHPAGCVRGTAFSRWAIPPPGVRACGHLRTRAPQDRSGRRDPRLSLILVAGGPPELPSVPRCQAFGSRASCRVVRAGTLRLSLSRPASTDDVSGRRAAARSSPGLPTPGRRCCARVWGRAVTRYAPGCRPRQPPRRHKGLRLDFVAALVRASSTHPRVQQRSRHHRPLGRPEKTSIR